MPRKRTLAQEQEQPVEPQQPRGAAASPVQEEQGEHGSPISAPKSSVVSPPWMLAQCRSITGRRSGSAF